MLRALVFATPFDFARIVPAAGRYHPDRLTVRAAAESIRKAPIEVGYGFDAHGLQSFRQVGDEARIIRFRANDLAAIKGGTFLHNHPPFKEFAIGDPRR